MKKIEERKNESNRRMEKWIKQESGENGVNGKTLETHRKDRIAQIVSCNSTIFDAFLAEGACIMIVAHNFFAFGGTLYR